MGNLKTIVNAIKTNMQTVQVNSSTAFVDVLTYPTNEFTGYPSVIIVPSGVPSQFATVQQNERTYTVDVVIYIQIDGQSISPAYANGADVLDAVLDSLDKDAQLSNTCDFIVPVTGTWQQVETEDGLALAIPVQVNAMKTINLF